MLPTGEFHENVDASTDHDAVDIERTVEPISTAETVIYVTGENVLDQDPDSPDHDAVDIERTVESVVGSELFDHRMEYVLSNAEGYAADYGLPFDRQAAREALVAQMAPRSRDAASIETDPHDAYFWAGAEQLQEMITAAQDRASVHTDYHVAVGAELFDTAQLAVSVHQYNTGTGAEIEGSVPQSGEPRTLGNERQLN
jgi:hypothetical protein